jgi:hypothetical protein
MIGPIINELQTIKNLTNMNLTINYLWRKYQDDIPEYVFNTLNCQDQYTYVKWIIEHRRYSTSTTGNNKVKWENGNGIWDREIFILSPSSKVNQ